MSSPARLAGRTVRWPAAIFLATTGVAALAVTADWWTCLPEDTPRRYVGRKSCAECHAREVEDWTGSHHDLAMQRATPESVLGDFDDATIAYQGVTSRMFRRGEKYFIHTEGPDGRMADFEVKYTFGVTPLQQYMVAFDDGRIQVLRLSWDTEKRKWFYVPPPDVTDEKIEAGDPLHWTGAAQNWNHTCADCHSTDLRKNYDLAESKYHTKYVEIDVSCEACHGPASLHLELAGAKSLFWDRHHGYGLAKLKGKNTKAQIDTCARCHARRSVLSEGYEAGKEFLDYYEPSLLHEGLYHADGQILDEVYVYGSFLQSKMYHKGVRCTDCHNPHTTRVKFDDNRLCNQCHQPGKYDVPGHHHHEAGTKGASCVECHMPETTYMVVDPRRDHSIRVPRPDLSALLGTPNACNGCHDKPGETPEWAAQKIVEWFGPKRPDDPHFAPALAAGRAGRPEGEKLLIEVVARRATPDIVRATAIELLAGYETPASAAARLEALGDRSPLVRAAAARSLPAIDPEQRVEALAPLVEDRARNVRIAAARALAGMPRNLLSSSQRKSLDDSLQEFVTAQLTANDRAAAHLNLGNLYQQMGRDREAARSLQTAIDLEPYLAGGRANLAALLESRNGDAAGIERLRREELELLARDARQLPDNAVAQHRHGLMLYLTGANDEAVVALAKACDLEPSSFDYRLMLTLLYEKIERWDEAVESARTLLELRPDDRVAGEILRRIEAARGG